MHGSYLTESAEVRLPKLVQPATLCILHSGLPDFWTVPTYQRSKNTYINTNVLKLGLYPSTGKISICVVFFLNEYSICEAGLLSNFGNLAVLHNLCFVGLILVMVVLFLPRCLSWLYVFVGISTVCHATICVLSCGQDLLLGAFVVTVEVTSVLRLRMRIVPEIT